MITITILVGVTIISFLVSMIGAGVALTIGLLGAITKRILN